MTGLLAQAVTSDPYYCGMPADRRDAEYFTRMLDAIGLGDTSGIHLRRIHYRLDALADDLDARVSCNGNRYGNDKNSWAWLCRASKHARRLGLVNPRRFVDRRNPDPVINRRRRWDDLTAPSAALVNHYNEADADAALAYLPSVRLPHIHVDADVDRATTAAVPSVDVAGYDYDPADQPALVEVWCEKTTVTDVLAPVCVRADANYVPASGTQSITAALALLDRAQELDRPAHVLYVSDHDHKGRNMPLSVARDVQYWRDRLGFTVPVTVDNLVLTADQVAAYGLPRDPERGDSTELDALEALHPGELARIVADAAEQFTDRDLESRLGDAETEALTVAIAHRDALLEDLLDERDRLIDDVDNVDLDAYEQRVADHVAGIQRHIDGLRVVDRDLSEAMAPYRDRLLDLRDRAAERLAGFDPDLPERPAAVTVEPPERVLYDSHRGWLDQLDAYQAHKGNGSGGAA